MPDPTIDDEVLSDDDPYDEDYDGSVVPIEEDDTAELDMDSVWNPPGDLDEPDDFDDGSSS